MKSERVTMNAQGRIIIPARIRKQLKLKHGILVVSIEENALRLTPLEDTVKNMQALVRKYSKPGEATGTEALFAMRRAEFAKEQALLEGTNEERAE
jgi:AbrB family looped-hinge helix DNA binding protein